MSQNEPIEYLELNARTFDPLKVIRYEKYVKADEYSDYILTSTGLLSIEKKRFHKYLGFNKFSKQSYPIPLKSDGWTGTYERIIKDYKEEVKCCKESSCEMDMTFEEFLIRNQNWHKKYVVEHMADLTAQIFQPMELAAHPISKLLDNGYKMYETLDNGGIGFIVMCNESGSGNQQEKDVWIYGRTKNVIENCFSPYDQKYIIFDNLIKRYSPTELFIGKSGLNSMTKFSGGHGEQFDGNSILMRLDGLKYVHIGINVFEFTVDEPIIKYVSSVGNSSVPYPYAESQNWCYCMLNNTKKPIENYPNREELGEVFGDEDENESGDQESDDDDDDDDNEKKNNKNKTNSIDSMSMESVTVYIAGRNTAEERYEARPNDDDDDNIDHMDTDTGTDADRDTNKVSN